ncbi:MAG: prepilin-type N-terminal cleavage/methylation domain-containing protein [Desulfobacterales bacterium]|nr:prepilin-type N-terminal cleavage/methylation domain-containing protein [Desulfobacterales bacterium]
MMQKLRSNKEGFTLIELMIVIAIIGILAAIAIPNFIAYRNKAYCTQAETDASNAAAAISDYYSEPDNTDMVTIGDLTGVTSAGVAIGGTIDAITVTVADPGNCPRDNSFLLTIPATNADGWS